MVATQGGRVLSSVQRAILHPDLLLAVIAISVAVGAFHEIGHATALDALPPDRLARVAERGSNDRCVARADADPAGAR